MKSLPSNHQRDPLRDFIDGHRAEFDDEQPRDSVWRAIERDLPAAQRRLQPRAESAYSSQPRPKRVGVVRQLYPYWRKAAVACMLLTIGLLGGMLLADERADDPKPGIAQRAAELESFYQRELDRRLQLVASYQPEPELRRELASMTSVEFRNDADLNELAPGNERAVLEAMAQEYKAKLEALEHVLNQLHAAEVAQPRLNAPGPRKAEEL